MMNRLGVLLVAVTMAAGGAAPGDEASPDSTAREDSLEVAGDVTVDVLEHLDLLLDLEFLEFTEAFGDADVSAFAESESVTVAATR